MLVEYTKPNLFNIWINQHEAITLKPGINDIPIEKWEMAKKKGGVKKRLNDGSVKELEGASETTDETTAISEMRVGEAVDIIKRTYDIKLLENWLDSDNRSGITKACRKQLDFIEEQTKSKKDED